MTRKLIKWFVQSVLIGAIPLMAELLVRWAADQSVFTSPKNIPELMFLAAMVNLSSADDVEKASDVLDETEVKQKELKESLTIWHNLLMVGMAIACALFGVYLAVDTLSTNNKNFLPHFLFVAWMLTGIFFFSSLGAEIFINIRRKPETKI